MSKRILDMVGSILGLLLLSPLFLAIAVAIKLDSRGPVFFAQERLGRGGRPFRIYKFRTMVTDAARLAANVSPTHDPRVTRVGRFLRQSFLDELPQLFNVLSGQMSLVGPRPETPEFVGLYSEEERGVLSVKPGMTGPSQIAYTNEAEILAGAADPESFYVDTLLHDRVRLDLEYAQRSPTVLGDLRLIARTLRAILPGTAESA
jgi:lipopolysaccharide/colanic/teichoic acid biosynthesis glycosyltransferase